MISRLTYLPVFLSHLAVGFANGSVRILDAISLDEETEEVLRYSRDTVTHIVFSHDSQYLATAVSIFSTTLLDMFTTWNNEAFSL